MTLQVRGVSILVAMLAVWVTAAAAAKDRGAPRETRYEGTLDYYGHGPRPGYSRGYHSEQHYTTDGKGRVRLDWWTWWSDKDTARVPETYLVAGDSVFHRDAPDSGWKLLSGDEARLARLETLSGLPSELKSLTLRNPNPNRTFRRSTHGAGKQDAYIDLHAHPRLGDVRDSVIFTYPAKASNPAEMLLVLHKRDSQYRLTARRTEFAGGPIPDSVLQSPEAFQPEPEALMVGEPKIVAVAPGLWSLDMEDLDTRSLLVEFADHLAVIEFAVGSANGQRMVDAAKRRWPDKPIRYALFSHHHPHYTGGIRAMIAEGATVVTTPGNEALVKSLAALPFKLEPDHLARSPRPVVVQTFADRYELADSTNTLVAFNYGERSQHTDEFAVFWFPRQRVLFEAEQGWFRVNGKLRAGKRAVSLLAWMDEQKLDVDRIVQAWPMRDNEPSVSRAELAAMVQPVKK